MEILKVSEHTVHYVETDLKEWPYLRRNDPDNWEQAMGESWEPMYFCEEAEAAFQKWQSLEASLPSLLGAPSDG